MKMTFKKKKRSGLGIKWKLIAFLALFTSFVLIVVWTFQVLLLGSFYERVKLNELDKSSKALSAVITDPEALKKTAENVLSDSMIFSKVYKVSNETAFLIMSQNYMGNYFLKSATPEQLTSLFNSAVEANGVYFERIFSKNESDPSADYKELIYVQLVESDGELYIIMLNMIYTPLNSTVITSSASSESDLSRSPIPLSPL